MSLYLVATPIGNLEDITLRALRVLRESDYILSEDTRVTKKLLDHYQIKRPLISFHHHSPESRYKEVLSYLKKGLQISVVSDAGTPGVSDPGGLLVDFVRKNAPDVLIEPIPGASALTTAISVAGIKLDKFLFLGFLPHKKGRSKMIKDILESQYPVVLFESRYRVLKLLEEVGSLDSQKNIMIFREISKMHYSFYQGSASDLLLELKEDPNSTRGEFTIIIY